MELFFDVEHDCELIFSDGSVCKEFTKYLDLDKLNNTFKVVKVVDYTTNETYENNGEGWGLRE